MNVKFVVLKDTTWRLNGMALRMDKRIGKIARKTASDMARAAAKALLQPAKSSQRRVKTGLLRRSIKPQHRRIGLAHWRAIAGPSVHYAPYVEFGTGQQGQRDYDYYSQRYGWPYIHYRRNWPGMSAHPSLTPQPRAQKPEVDKALSEALEAEWNGR